MGSVGVVRYATGLLLGRVLCVISTRFPHREHGQYGMAVTSQAPPPAVHASSVCAASICGRCGVGLCDRAPERVYGHQASL